MASNRPIRIGLLIACAAGVALALWRSLNRPASSGPGKHSLVAVRLTPKDGPNGFVECESFAQVEFTYQIQNRGKSAVSGLKLGSRCASEVIGDVPSQIPPGASVPMTFRVRAPFAGVVSRQVPLVVEGETEPVVTLDARLRVKLDPPVLLPGGKEFHLTFLAGAAAPHKLTLMAIERRGRRPWIEGLDLSPNGALSVASLRIDEWPEADPDLVRRDYHFELECRFSEIRSRIVLATVRTTAEGPRSNTVLRLTAEVVDSVAIVPNPVVIRFHKTTTPQPRRVHIIDRAGDRTASVAEHDARLLEVTEVTGRQGGASVFDITPVADVESPRHTQVAFQLSDGEIRMVSVHLEPAARAEE